VKYVEMPICPGCEQRVDHEHLDVHERCCHGLRGAEGHGPRDLERLARRVEAIEDFLTGQADRESDDDPPRPVEQSRGRTVPVDRE